MNYHCMPPALVTDVFITEVVYDCMVVKINNPKLHDITLQYAIRSKESHMVIRKGSFKGQVIQLRVSHMAEGSYDFCIAPEGCEPLIVLFEKKSEPMQKYFGRF